MRSSSFISFGLGNTSALFPADVVEVDETEDEEEDDDDDDDDVDETEWNKERKSGMSLLQSH